MKTLTELSGALVRMAERAVAEALTSLPPVSTASPESTVSADSTPTPPQEAAPAESEELKRLLDDAVSQATGLSGDRLARLREALKAVGPRTENIRLVRVFAPDEKVDGAKRVGEFQYLVDQAPANMRQVMAKPEKRGGRGGGPGGGGGSGAGGGADAGAKAAAATTGGFSMDAVIQDRKTDRIRFGGGRSGAKHVGSGRARPGARPTGSKPIVTRRPTGGVTGP